MSMETRVSEHPLRRYGFVLGAALVAGGIGGFVASVVKGASSEGSLLYPLAVALTMSASMGAALWACAHWWRGLDEAAQEAHKSAWWWGCTYGLALGAVALFTLLHAGGADLLDGIRPVDAMLGGILLVALFQTVGYGIAWSVWWLRRR